MVLLSPAEPAKQLATQSESYDNNTCARHADTLFVQKEKHDLGRRRLQKNGHLYKENGWWRLRWREDVIGPDGEAARHRRSATLGPCEGPAGLTEKKAQRIAWDEYLSRVNQQELMPQSLMKVSDFIERRFNPEYVLALKLGGQVHYRVWLVHVVATLGAMSLREVRHEHVQRMCLGLLQKTYSLGKDRVRQVKDPKDREAHRGGRKAQARDAL
jgi:hypothetical protein